VLSPYYYFEPFLFQLIINIRSLQSCPAINVYSTTNLERGLKAAAENFCSQEVHVDMNAKRVRVHTPESRILWEVWQQLSRQQIVFALLVPSCQQVWNKLLQPC
jgi:acyl transferase domain-containing protein